jgi:hypothetical protein
MATPGVTVTRGPDAIRSGEGGLAASLSLGLGRAAIVGGVEALLAFDRFDRAFASAFGFGPGLAALQSLELGGVDVVTEVALNIPFAGRGAGREGEGQNEWKRLHSASLHPRRPGGQ